MKKQTNETKAIVEEGIVHIKPPKFAQATFEIVGDAPLVVHRFSAKTKEQLKQKMEAGSVAGSKKNREAKSTDDLYKESKYVAKDGWEGFHAGAIRNAMISACRLVNFKMTLAKLSVFVVQDGWDKEEPQIPLIKIYGTPIKQEDIARVETGQPYVCVRTAYHQWKAKVTIRWDADQFSTDDILNLLARAGTQVGICEGRPDSKNSAGQGWGTFHVGSIENTYKNIMEMKK